MVFAWLGFIIGFQLPPQLPDGFDWARSAFLGVFFKHLPFLGS